MKHFLFACGITLLSVALLRAEELPKLETAEGVAPAGVADAIAKTLQKTSYKITEEGKEVVHFWVREEIPSSASPGGLIGYDSVEEGTLIGVYEVKDDSFTDFRGQDLKPGVFTLRVASHPQDGNHMGIAPSPVFLCLVPAADDPKLDPIPIKELLELSKKAAGTGHPAALFLEPLFEAPTGPLPAIRKNDLEQITLDVETKAKLESEAARFPIAIVFIGQTEAE